MRLLLAFVAGAVTAGVVVYVALAVYLSRAFRR